MFFSCKGSGYATSGIFIWFLLETGILFPFMYMLIWTYMLWVFGFNLTDAWEYSMPLSFITTLVTIYLGFRGAATKEKELNERSKMKQMKQMK